jgi:hypothetical protein
MPLLARQPVFRHKPTRYERELKFKTFNFSLQLKNALVSPFALRTTAHAREPFPNQLAFLTCNPFPNRFAIVKWLFNRVSDRPTQYQHVTAALLAPLRPRGKLLLFGFCSLRRHAQW